MKKWLWITMIVALLLSLPSVIERSSAEWSNKTYETIIPYEEIQDLLDLDASLDSSEVLAELKEAGMHSVSLEPDTLKSLEAKGKLLVLSEKALREQLLARGKDPWGSELSEEKGVYIYPKDDQLFNNRIRPIFKVIKPMKFGDGTIYFIPEDGHAIMDVPLGYDKAIIKQVKSQGINVIPRIPDTIEADEYDFMIGQLQDLKDEYSEKVLFSGKNVPGFPEKKDVIYWAQSLSNLGYTPFSIEFSDQKGYSTIAHMMSYQVIRLHSLDLASESKEVNVDRVVRAVKERNIKAVFVHIPPLEKAEDSLTSTISFLQAVQKEMPSHYVAGNSKTFKQIDRALWELALILVACVAFLGLAVLEVTRNKWLTYAMMAGISLIAVVHLATGMSLLAKGIALAVAVSGPVFAVIPKRQVSDNKGILSQYGLAALISLCTVWIIVSLLNGNQFLVKIEDFKGVKLLYIIPIVFMVVYAVWGSLINLLKFPVRYWHIAIMVPLAALVYYYISRTGNAGTASSVELTARQALEKWMYVRPRTKEFLLGFPFYVLALYVGRFNKRVGLYLLIPSVIGFLSLVNTFTHLHIPLYVSLLRSFYGLALGLVIGIIFIYLYKLLVRSIKWMKVRWHF